MKVRSLSSASVVVALALAVAGIAFAAEAGKLNLKVGDSYYVCGCPPGCCEDISSKEGKCGCGKDLKQIGS